jgi:hypothetical protein
LSATTGRDEARCMYSTGYTDDVVTLVLGAEAALRYVCLHEELLGSGGLNVLMASEEKRSLGVSAPFIGANVLTVGGIGYLGPAKVHSTLEVLALAIEGNLTLARFVRLAGMLNHLVIILSLPYKEMYAVYGMLDRTRSLGRGLDELVECTDAGVASLGRFRDGLLGTAGVSAMASVFPMLPAVDGGVVNVMRSDAAIKGTGNPALAGNLKKLASAYRLGADASACDSAADASAYRLGADASACDSAADASACDSAGCIRLSIGGGCIRL